MAGERQTRNSAAIFSADCGNRLSSKQLLFFQEWGLMFEQTAWRRWSYLAAGVIVGLVLGGLWPDSPAHAVATAQIESFAVCTAPIDDEGEGIFFLDYLTGDLKGATLSPNNGKFAAFFQANVTADLGIDPSKAPKYLLVSGVNNFRRAAGGPQFGSSTIYVAELTSGKVVAYGIPWQRNARNANAPIQANLMLLDSFQFRNVQVRNP
jgi:hypothetical protein